MGCNSFLNARDVKVGNIHRQISEVYRKNAISDGMVRKWVRAFKEGRTNVHDEALSGGPSVINDDLVQKVKEKVHENRWLRFRHCLMNFLKFQEVFSMKL